MNKIKDLSKKEISLWIIILFFGIDFDNRVYKEDIIKQKQKWWRV